MKKRSKILLGLIILLSLGLAQGKIGYAQALDEQRELVIQNLMTGTTENFSYEEVEAYLASEEVALLESGEFKSYVSYGMNHQHSTVQGMLVEAYLRDYLEVNSDIESLYPYAVDFEALPDTLNFYGVNDDDYSFEDFIVYNRSDQLEIHHNYWNAHQTHLRGDVYHGSPTLNGTQEVLVFVPDAMDDKYVKVNSQVIIQEEIVHRKDYIFYFFYNDQGGISLLKWDALNSPRVLKEYVTLETRAELEAMVVGWSEWSLPEDWRMLSPRRLDVPPVTWVLTSVGNGEDIAIEPIFGQEGIVSGYINPNYTVEVKTVNVYGDNATSFYTGQPNQDGYFSIDADVTFGMEPSIKIFDGNGRVVYESDLEVYQYRPTALEHESGYLTLERYFIGQDYMEGYTYPGAEVSFFYLDGYASTGRPSVTADSTGYFYAEVPGHQTAKKTTLVSVMHPETGEKITVAPYPWTQEELDNAQW